MLRATLLSASAAVLLAAPAFAASTPAPGTQATPIQVAPQTPAAAPAAAPKPHKATPEERAEAERLEPLARAAFWARETDADPLDADAGIHLASALRTLGQYDPAIQAVTRILVVQPKNLEALLELSRDYVASGQGFYAIDPLKRAQAMAPKDWRPASLLGVAYAEVKRTDDAQAAWRVALALSPNNPAVLSNMAMTDAAAGDGAQAEALLRQAAAQPGADLTIRQNLTLVLGMEGKLGEAETLLRQDLPPDQADADLAYLRAASSGDPGAPGQTVDQAAPAPNAHSWGTLQGAGG